MDARRVQLSVVCQRRNVPESQQVDIGRYKSQVENLRGGGQESVGGIASRQRKQAGDLDDFMRQGLEERSGRLGYPVVEVSNKMRSVSCRINASRC